MDHYIENEGKFYTRSEREIKLRPGIEAIFTEGKFKDDDKYTRDPKHLDSIYNTNFILYVVRNAESLNESKNEQKKYKKWARQLINILGIPTHIDPELTENGMDQAKITGDFFKMNSIKFDFVLTSELLRARQTAYEILKITNIDTKNIVPTITINPVPCINEVSIYARGNCFDTFRAPQNKSKCFNNYKLDECKKYNTNWDTYKKLSFHRILCFTSLLKITEQALVSLQLIQLQMKNQIQLNNYS